MAYVSWFQKKLVLAGAVAVLGIIFLFNLICTLKHGNQVRLLQKLQDEVRSMKSKMNSEQIHNLLRANDPLLPTIFLITPTYTRYTQLADLTRMLYTLKHVNKLHWILVEDSEVKTKTVITFLNHCGVPHTHLNVRTQKDLVMKKNDPRWKKHRGVDQRNHALKWIRETISSNSHGVVYFADDDNTYHLDLFKEMRWIKQVAMWPVALVGGLRWEGPVCKDGKVIKFHTAWMPSRKFPVDMAAFAVNLKRLFEYPDAYLNPDVQRGWLETDFLQQLFIGLNDLEAKANNCMKILVWHTQTADPKMKGEIRLQQKGAGSDPKIIV